ncbi:glycosyltransferase family 4 protein [Parabacteroides goldsteinii]|uniref:glycosyltransferase family 4 protein n=1 Tax=Parabacteroides goldsteinii TaxID=328812 RepID=UPI00321C2DEF
MKLIRISTIPSSMEGFLKGQLRFLSDYYDVIAVSSPGKKLDAIRQRENVKTIALPMERRISLWKDLMSLVRMILLFVKEKPYIIHSITPKAGLISMLAGWVVRVPVRIHTFTGLVFPTATGKMQKLLIAMDRITCFCATHINPEGIGVKRDLERFNVTKKPMFIIANGNVGGIDLIHFDRTSAVEEETIHYHQTAGCFTFCFIGRMVRDKGINELIHVFIRLYQKNTKIRLLLVGPFEKDLDPVLPEVEEQILHHPGITFVGWQPDVRPFLAASDAFVFPSYREGFPNVVMQAGAMGLASIVTDINGCNEIIVDGKNGVIIPSKDEEALYQAMKDFVVHPEKVKQMAANARPMIASRYEQKMVWEALLEEYRRVCKEKW